jgi:hypothetical protein
VYALFVLDRAERFVKELPRLGVHFHRVPPRLRGHTRFFEPRHFFAQSGTADLRERSFLAVELFLRQVVLTPRELDLARRGFGVRQRPVVVRKRAQLPFVLRHQRRRAVTIEPGHALAQYLQRAGLLAVLVAQRVVLRDHRVALSFRARERCLRLFERSSGPGDLPSGGGSERLQLGAVRRLCLAQRTDRGQR